MLIESKEERDKAIFQIKREYSIDGDDLKGPFYLEGSSKPDVFIETEKIIIVIEGKWTERTTTDSTTYVEHRNQMVRHIHGAINYRRLMNMEKTVYGFYIVSDEFSENDENAISKEAFSDKLENQFGIDNLKQQIDAAYKGFITWEMIGKIFPEVTSRWKEKAE